MALRKRQPTESEKEQFLDLVMSGVDPYVAARQVDPGLTASRFRDVLDTEWQARYVAAKADALEARAAKADERADEWVNDPECPPAVRIVWLKRWNREFSERYHLAVEQEIAQGASGIISSPPSIVVDNLTDAEMAELESCVARVHELAALARERTTRPAGEVEAA